MLLIYRRCDSTVGSLYACSVTSVMFDSLKPHRLYSPPGSSVHGILQVRILEWIAKTSFRGTSWPRDWTHVSYVSWTQAGFLPLVPPGKHMPCLIQFSSVQSLRRVRLFATPWIAARQASLSITNSWSSLRLTSIESVMPSSHLILGHPLLLLPPIPPSIRVFFNESTLHMRWPKYWSFMPHYLVTIHIWDIFLYFSILFNFSNPNHHTCIWLSYFRAKT